MGLSRRRLLNQLTHSRVANSTALKLRHSPDHLGLEQAIDRFSESIVIRVADVADRGFDPGLGKTVGVAQCEVLRPAIRMMHASAALNGTALVQGLL